ncbi:MAG TPA: MerR family transcriptional regulator [Actinobacteria bacterium]|nr:MerR family transcriptional regulator [Actinomycetota bacterium]
MGHTLDMNVAGAPPDDIAMSVANAAALLGLTPSTLRTWDRRYGMSPSVRTNGGHRRYNADDLTRLRLAARLIDSGLPPAGATTAVINWSIAECRKRLGADSTSSIDSTSNLPAEQRPGGGRAIPMPRATTEQRGLMRAAMSLDPQAVRDLMSAAMQSRGVVRAWEDLAAPTLIAIGNRWENTREAVEVEHTASIGLQQALDIPAPEVTRARPILLCCLPEEQHGLALLALRAALIENRTPTVMLGTRMPEAGLIAATARLRPKAVVLWASMSENADPAVLRALPSQRPPIRAFVAGPGWNFDLEMTEVTPLSSLTDAMQKLPL